LVSGTKLAIVQAISYPATSSACGTLPKNVVKSGFHVPQVGSLSREQVTVVPSRAPSSAAELGVHDEAANRID
jgi:hypothetical protein